MIQFRVNVTDGASPALRAIIDSLSGQKAEELNERGGRAAVNAAVKYHRDFDKNGGWRGKRYLGPSTGEGSSFGSDVARGWSLAEITRGGVTISNDAAHYAFKTRGGTIRPKRAKYLTIPLIAEARGLYASVYQQNTGKRLFKSKSGKALMESTGKGAARPVYALVRSVTMGPWPGAVPDEDLITSAFLDRWKAGLAELIEAV